MDRKSFIKPVGAILVVVMMFCLVAAACSSDKNMVFSCSSDNRIGISRVDFSSGELTVFFDKDKALNGDMKALFEEDDEALKATVWIKYDSEDVLKDDIKVDADDMTVKIRIDAQDRKDIRALDLRCGQQEFKLYIEEPKLESISIYTEGESGPLKGAFTTSRVIYTQEYDEKSGSWSEATCDTDSMTIWQ